MQIHASTGCDTSLFGENNERALTLQTVGNSNISFFWAAEMCWSEVIEAINTQQVEEVDFEELEIREVFLHQQCSFINALSHY